MKKRLWVIRLLGVLLLIFILTRIDLPNVASAIAKVNLWYLVLVIILHLPVVFLKAWRWQYLLKMQGVTYPLRHSFPAYFSGVYLGLTTPGRLGDFARVLYLRHDKELPVGGALSSVLVDRLYDIYLLVIVGGFGLIAFSPLGERTVLFILFLVFILAVFSLFLNWQIGKRAVSVIYKVSALQRLKAQIDTSVDQFYAGLGGLTRKGLIFCSLLTLVAYAIYFGQCYLLALSLNLSLSFLYVTSCMAVAVLITMIPISIAGIGTRDGTLIFLFSLQGVSAESALSYSLLVLFTFYICGAAMGAIAWQIKPLYSSRKVKSNE